MIRFRPVRVEDHHAAAPVRESAASRMSVHPACLSDHAISAWRRSAVAGLLYGSTTEDEISQCGTKHTSYEWAPLTLSAHVSASAPRRKTHRKIPADSTGRRTAALFSLVVVMDHGEGNNSASACIRFGNDLQAK